MVMLLPEYFECAYSRADFIMHGASAKHIQNKNENLNDFLSLGIRTSKTNFNINKRVKKNLYQKLHVYTSGF